MGLLSRKPSATQARMLGQLMALRAALEATVRAASADPAVRQELLTARVVGLAKIRTSRYPQPLEEGFEDFINAFVAAARKHG